MSASAPPTRFAAALFPGFQALDIFGPLDILNSLSREHPLTLTILSPTAGPVSTATPSSGHSVSESVVPTRTYADALSQLAAYPEAKDVEVLIVPGGFGTRDPANVADVEEYVKRVFPHLRYLLTVCTGSALVARTGVLDGRRATSNKRSWDWAISQGPRVNWVPRARWVVDGNLWTSSGISAGIDMMYAFVADQFGEDVASRLADDAEYVRNTDSTNDPFAIGDEKNGVEK